tara:strand:- start:663 stop:1334 length:672 start_codon:yes stop_codon:yes gene_type:complete
MEVSIRNQELSSTLDSFIDEFFAIDGYDSSKHRVYSTQRALDDPEYFCGDEYLQSMLNIGPDHSGFPEEHMAHPTATMVRNNPEAFSNFRDRIKHTFAKRLGAHTNALMNYYPPGGFVGWHTNWNSNAYQVLFTWSRTGDGYFKYREPSGKIVTIQDRPGWQCRTYYFGKIDEPEHHCWHTAYAGCDRFTLAYKFENEGKDNPADVIAQMMRDDLIEEIENEH